MIFKSENDVCQHAERQVQGLTEAPGQADRSTGAARKSACVHVGPAPSDHISASLARLMQTHPAALLAGIDADELKQFLARCKILICHSEREIIRQGTFLNQAYLVLRGAVEISIFDLEGNCVLAHLAQAGEVVGEVELLTDRICLANCLARPGTTVAGFDLPLLRQFIPAERLLRNLACTFHDRLTRDNRLHLVAMFYCSEDRIRSHLLSLTTPDQPQATISQADLAAFSGCSRQTVNRTLAQLRSDGLVEVTRGKVVILDRDRLQKLSMGAKPRDPGPQRDRPTRKV